MAENTSMTELRGGGVPENNAPASDLILDKKDLVKKLRHSEWSVKCVFELAKRFCGLWVWNDVNVKIKQPAFTMAEILITLGIIGIVAAMSLPQLMSKYNEKVTISRLLKAYSMMNNSSRLMIAENGKPSDWITDERDFSEDIAKIWAKYLDVATVCGKETNGCIYNKNRVTNVSSLMPPDPSNYSQFTYGVYQNYKMLLKNGDAIIIWSSTAWFMEKDGNYSYIMYVFNALQKRAEVGKTAFVFMLTDNGVEPIGGQNSKSAWVFPYACTMDSASMGGASDRNGLTCASWVIYNRNMDYLHCTGLSWNGKSSCK